MRSSHAKHELRYLLKYTLNTYMYIYIYIHTYTLNTYNRASERPNDTYKQLEITAKSYYMMSGVESFKANAALNFSVPYC